METVAAQKKGIRSQGCIYCGAAFVAMTADHVPPKKLFPKPRPTNLITVPACETCNQSFSEDDEYFRFAMVTPSYDHPAGRLLWENEVVKSTFHRHPKLISQMVARIRTIELRSYSGLHLGRSGALPFEWRRVTRVVRRISKGLIWHHFRRIAPNDGSITVITDPNHLDIAVQGALEDGKQARKVGDGSVFAYRFGYVGCRPEASIWLLQFYSRLNFLVLSIPKDLTEEESGDLIPLQN
jgi:hypothetical protein